MSKHLTRALAWAAVAMTFVEVSPAAGGALHLTARSREKVAPDAAVYEVVEEAVEWDPVRTAVIVIDMWDRHWCDGANRRGAEIAPRINELVKVVRDRGGFIIHAPSDTMAAYEGTPQRKLAQEAPKADGPSEFKWNYIDPAVEG